MEASKSVTCIQPNTVILQCGESQPPVFSGRVHMCICCGFDYSFPKRNPRNELDGGKEPAVWLQTAPFICRAFWILPFFFFFLAYIISWSCNHPSSEVGYHCHLLSDFRKSRFIRLKQLAWDSRYPRQNFSWGICLKCSSWKIFKHG